MRNVLLALLFVFLTLPLAAQNTATDQDLSLTGFEYWESVLSETSVNTTGTLVDLSSSSRSYPSQVFYLYNNSAGAALEWALGGESVTTCTGASPVVEVVASEVYTVNVAATTKLRRGRIVEIYDGSAANAVLLNGEIISVDHGLARVTVRYVSGTSPTSAVSGDVVGGPFRYSFVTGTGHLVQPNSSVQIKPLGGRPILHLRAASSTVNARVVQGN